MPVPLDKMPNPERSRANREEQDSCTVITEDRHAITEQAVTYADRPAVAGNFHPGAAGVLYVVDTQNLGGTMILNGHRLQHSRYGRLRRRSAYGLTSNLPEFLVSRTPIDVRPLQSRAAIATPRASHPFKLGFKTVLISTLRSMASPITCIMTIRQNLANTMNTVCDYWHGRRPCCNSGASA